jgi:hypothetical protein
VSTGEFGYVAARDLGLEHVVPLILIDAHPVMRSARAQHLIGPDASVEYSVRMQRIDADIVDTPLECCDPGDLRESGLGSGVGGSPWPWRGNVFRSNHGDTAAAWSQLEQGIALAQEHEIGIQVDAHGPAPSFVVERCNRRRGGKDAGVQHQDIQAAISTHGRLEGGTDVVLRGHVAAYAAEVGALVQLFDAYVEVETYHRRTSREQGSDAGLADTGSRPRDQCDFAGEQRRLA